MPVPAAVVVNSAGVGSRLGINAPKALLEIAGRPLIAWQLDLLRGVDDVRVVVGYRGADVADIVFDVRPDATVVVNHDHLTTGTASSLMLGAAALPTSAVVSLDCDLVVHPVDLEAFVRSDRAMVGTVEVQSIEPVYVHVTDDERPSATGFGRLPSDGAHEWSGLVRFDPGSPRLGPRTGHVFELIQRLLPMPARAIRAREVDYPEEIEPLAEWIKTLDNEGAFG